ncbi:MAG: YciI family protein [Acidobacteriota bacterium]
MPQFIFLLRDDATAMADISPDEMQAVIEKYAAWGRRLEAAGQLVASDKLRDDEGRVLRPGPGGVRVIDGPYSETKEVVGGYFTVIADDYDGAEAIARSCPHVELGGVLEIRRIENVDGADGG